MRESVLLNFSLLNVQGLVTKYTNKLQSEELIEIFQSNDIILLTEIWTNDLCDISVDGFSVFQLNRVEKKHNAKRDSGGIVLYIKNSLMRHCELLKKENDDVIWLKIDKSLLHLSFDLYLCLCYVIPTGSSREALTEMSVLDRISEYIVKIANDTRNCYNILICGDLNSRTGTEHDFVILDNSNNDVLPDDYVPDEFFVRSSEDKTINSNGRKSLDFCRQNGLRICNGRIGEDRNFCKCTFIGGTGRSLVDYVISNPSMFEVFCKFKVCEPNILSDHCELEFSLYSNINNYTEQREETEPRERLSKKYVWDDAKKDQYIFNLIGVENEFSDLTSNLMQACEPADIDENINTFLNLMEKACDPLFAKNLNVPTGESTYLLLANKQQRPWFDEECQTLRERFYRALNNYRECKNNINERNMINARSNLKKNNKEKAL